MAVNYASKYSQNVDERFSTGSLTNGIVNGEFDWIGVSTVNVYSIPTSAMNDYSLSGTNRYGTPEELGNETQEMTLKQDRWQMLESWRIQYNLWKSQRALCRNLYQWHKRHWAPD